MHFAKMRPVFRTSSGMMPSLARLRIQQCFKNAKPLLGTQILKRACSLRSEIKVFLTYLSEEKMDELARDIFVFITESVASIDDPDKVNEIYEIYDQHSKFRYPCWQRVSGRFTRNYVTMVFARNSSQLLLMQRSQNAYV